MTTPTMRCETLDERLPDYLERELAPAGMAEVDAHLAACARCSALVRDLTEISASASRLPALAPSRDLWDGIAARIEAPVVPLAAPAGRAASVAPRRREWLRTGLAAAGLVIATAGITWSVARQQLGQAPAAEVVATTSGSASARPASPASAEPATPRTDPRPNPAGQSEPPQVAVAGSGAAAAAAAEVMGAAAGAEVRVAGNVPQAPGAFTRRTLQTEIQELQAAVERRRAELDPKTVAIVEHSLRVIDEAIAQSRAALASDPASRFLNDKLNSALDRKVELLRTVALLPARS